MWQTHTNRNVTCDSNEQYIKHNNNRTKLEHKKMFLKNLRVETGCKKQGVKRATNELYETVQWTHNKRFLMKISYFFSIQCRYTYTWGWRPFVIMTAKQASTWSTRRNVNYHRCYKLQNKTERAGKTVHEKCLIVCQWRNECSNTDY